MKLPTLEKMRQRQAARLAERRRPPRRVIEYDSSEEEVREALIGKRVVDVIGLKVGSCDIIVEGLSFDGDTQVFFNAAQDWDGRVGNVYATIFVPKEDEPAQEEQQKAPIQKVDRKGE